MRKPNDWANQSGDGWCRHWRALDLALSELGRILADANREAAPPGLFRAFDIGCGAGSTSIALAHDRPDATIVACDLSPALVRLASERLAEVSGATVRLGDARQLAKQDGPFDLLYSRHGVMFFDDPVAAFRDLHAATSPGSRLVFSCFADWSANIWASDLSSAVADRTLPAPDPGPGAFAFADPADVRSMLEAAGWTDPQARSAPFRYIAGRGTDAVEHAVMLLTEIGPASRTLSDRPETERPQAVARMRRIIEAHLADDEVTFAAAAWIWTARA